jgi:hypothetical protein
MVIDILNQLYDKEYQLTIKYTNNRTVDNWNELLEFRQYALQVEEAIGLDDQERDAIFKYNKKIKI